MAIVPALPYHSCIDHSFKAVDMNTSGTQHFTPSFAAEREPSIWRRIFDAWVRSNEGRLDPNGMPFFDL